MYKNHGHTRIECFSNVDWVGSKANRRSTLGYCAFVGGNLISWKSKKQRVISRSSAESKYRAMAQSVHEIMGICQLLMEVGIETSLPAMLWCDNQVVMHIACRNQEERIGGKNSLIFSLIHCEYIYTKVNLIFLIDYNSI